MVLEPSLQARLMTKNQENQENSMIVNDHRTRLLFPIVHYSSGQNTVNRKTQKDNQIVQ